MSGDREDRPPGGWKMPMPRLIPAGEAVRLEAAGEWPPPPRPNNPEDEPVIEHGDRIVPPSEHGDERIAAAEMAPDLGGKVEAGIAAFYERLRDPPPWEVERTARKKAEAEAAAKKAKKDKGG